MNSSWIIERWRLITLLVVIVLLGLASGNWLISIILPITVYIGWLLLQLYRIDRWLLNGATNSTAPDVSGVLESIVSYILLEKRRNKSRRKNLAKRVKEYRDTIVALPDAAVILNAQYEIEWANYPADKLLGISNKRDKGFRITNLIRDPKFGQYLEKAGAESKTQSHKRAMEFASPVDHERILLVSIIRYGQGQRLLIGRDISERVQSRLALQAFVSNASHELRTPLTVTSGYIDLLLDDPSLPEECQAPITQLREQTDRMTELINDLLILSKLEGDPLDAYEGKVINLPVLLSQITNDLLGVQAMSQSASHQFQLDIDSTLGLLGVEREIISIIENLIGNAIKYTPPGTLIEVTWKADKEGRPVLGVHDEGAGFDASFIPKLTNRFYRLDNRSTLQQEGTGLGLAIVKHAVLRHGGQLKIKSKVGEGAQFSACFPETRAIKL